MSTKGVAEHCETIYNLIKEDKSEDDESFKYESRYYQKVKEEVEVKQHKHKTMGYAEVPLRGPKDFLKKKTRVAPQKLICDKPKPVKEKLFTIPPKVTEEGIKDTKSKTSVKNYVNENVTYVKTTKLREPRRRYIDTVHGDVHDLDVSGLIPHHRLSKNYGKLPNYLQKIRKEIDDSVQQETLKSDNGSRRQYVTESERKEILQGMKLNWDELQRQFQTLPMMTDTLPKIKHKLKLENQLEQLEQNIKAIEEHEAIYIIDDLP